MRKQDLSFVIGTSINSLSKYHKTIFKGYDYEKSLAECELKILYVLSRYDLYNCFVVSDKEGEQDIIAYLIADPVENHVMLQYTKYLYRDRGIQKHLLLPLLIDDKKEITVNWPTKKMFKFAEKKKLVIEDRLTAKLIEEHRDRLIAIDEYKLKEYEGVEYGNED